MRGAEASTAIAPADARRAPCHDEPDWITARSRRGDERGAGQGLDKQEQPTAQADPAVHFQEVGFLSHRTMSRIARA